MNKAYLLQQAFVSIFARGFLNVITFTHVSIKLGRAHSFLNPFMTNYF